MSESPKAAARPAARTVEISADDAGMRIDNFLSRELRGVPRGRVYRVLRRGEVRVNGGRVRAGHRLETGDKVRLPPLRVAEPGTATVPAALAARLEQAIVFEDKRLIVLDKPAGLAAHGGSGIEVGVIEALRTLRPGRLELVHRLDRDTSGCLMVAKRRSELRALHELLREGAIDKRYFALLVGRLREDKVVCEAPLGQRRIGAERRAVVDEGGKAARTEFRLAQRLRGATLVEVVLHTGRMHQIRAHAAHLGNPVAGDERYGDRRANRDLARRGLSRLFLHAHALSFVRPHDGESVHIAAPLDDELRAVVDALS